MSEPAVPPETRPKWPDFEERMAYLVEKLRARCEAPGKAFPEKSCRCIPCWAAAVIEGNVLRLTA